MNDILVTELPAELTQATQMLGTAKWRRLKTGQPTNDVLRQEPRAYSESQHRMT